MPLHRTKASAAGLGKALINRRAREAAEGPKQSQLYVLDEGNPLQSVTQERDLDEFLANAALADADFTTERSRTRIISGTNVKNPFLLSEEEEKEVVRRQVDLREGLHVPRRPPWTKKTTRAELERQERDAFLDWRRSLAQLAESSSLLLTPFERNIQLWRQLWRVLERSQLVVQIVDARNPLGFRCIDLENYVRELEGGKRSLLLINKADLLTEEQRTTWADYFEREGIAYAFFSAVAAAQDQERRRADGENGVDGDMGSSEDEELEEDDEDGEEEDNGLLNGVDNPDDETLDDDEDGWSTEGEDDDHPADPLEEKLEDGERSPLSEAVRQLDLDPQRRTHVLSVPELEELFESAAPSNPETSDRLVIGLVGYPNVGKSSTINALLGEKKTSVSATPGKTKHFQTLLLSDHITLCDCPGLVFPQFANTQADMIVDGVLPIDQMREHTAPVELICKRIPRDILEGTYGIRIDVKATQEGGSGQVDWEDFLNAYAVARGMTRASFGMPDTSRAARYVLKDYVNARLLYAHPPPGIPSDVYMSSSREVTRQSLGEKKRAPVTHVGKDSDTFIPSAPTVRIVKASAASAPGRTGKERSDALDNLFFDEQQKIGYGTTGRSGESGERASVYGGQRSLGPDGRPIAADGQGTRSMGKAGKRHFKGREGKKRSGKGYD